MGEKIKVLMAKPGLDGHDLGAKFMARVLRDAGMEVVYTGRQQTPEQVVEAAIQEDVDVIGLSFLSGAHLALTQKIIGELKKKGLEKEFLIVVGGTISSRDIPLLKEIGVAEVFPVETDPEEAVRFLKSNVQRDQI